MLEWNLSENVFYNILIINSPIIESLLYIPSPSKKCFYQTRPQNISSLQKIPLDPEL